MNSPMDAVQRRRRAANGAFGVWTTPLGPTIGVLRSFHPDAWPVLAVLLTWLLMAGLYPVFAASNAMLVFTGGSLGYLVGSRVSHLGTWSGGILVPRYLRSLFALCLCAVVLPTLLTAFACWSLGNPQPAVAPALLVGLAMARRAIRKPLPPSGAGVWWLILIFALLCGGAFAGQRSPLVQLAQATSVLSNVWIQLACAVGAGFVVSGLSRALAQPTTHDDDNVVSPVGLGDFSLGEIRSGTSYAAAQLGVIVLIWYFFPKTAEWMFLFFWYLSLAQAMIEWWGTTAHIQLSRDWVFGAARNRNDLGRRTAAHALWISLPWLVLGTGWSGVHALVAPGNEAFFLKEVLLAHIAALLLVTSLCHLTRRLPPSFPCQAGVEALLVGLFTGGCYYFLDQDYDAGGHAVLLLALIGAAVLAVLLGGRALAQAEVLTEVSDFRDWRKRKR